MQVPGTHLVDRAGVAAVAYAAGTQLGWLFREQDTSDVGIDAQLEVVEHGEATGRLLAVQIKSGRSWFGEPAAGGWWFRCGEEHAAYWRGHSLPVVVMLHHPEQERVYWQHVCDDTLVSTGRGWKILVPASQQLTAEAAQALAAPARPQPDAFQAAVDRLPRDARIALLRDHQAGAPYAAGLAMLLAQAADPAMVVRTLLEDPPGWLSGLHGEQRAGAWRAVAGYAVAHQLGPVAVDALEHAADAVADAADGDNGIGAGRLRVLAAIVAAGTDPGRAQALIAAAEASSPVLAAVARALLPGPGREPSQLPETVARALATGDEAATGDPTVLRFVAQTHFAAGRHDEGVAALEAAMNRAPDDPGLQAEMAAALTRNTATGAPVLAYLDIQRAYRLALAARAEYRRWRGPSAEAALVLLRIRTIADDVSAALRTAVPAPDGEAQGPESGSAPLLLEAARLAYHAGQRDLADSFAQQLSDGGARAQLAAIAVDSRPDVANVERVAAWTSAIDEATDDDQRMVAAMTLTALGVWPVAVLDQLRDQGTIPDAVYHVRWACAEAFAGDQDAAIRRLRQWEATSVTAAMALVGLYEDAGDLTAAAETAERAGNRFGDLALRLHAVGVWSRAGRPERARLRALTLLSRPVLPDAMRRELRGTAVQWAYDRQDWVDMEDHALAGLAEEHSTEALPTAAPGAIPLSEMAASFAWAAIRAQLQARRLDAARATLTRYTPPVRRAEEARLWMTVVDWAGWTLPDAEQALALAEQFAADTPVRAGLLARLLHATGGPHTQDPDPSAPIPVQSPLLLPDHLGHQLQTLLAETPTSEPELNSISFNDLTAHIQQTLAPRQPVIDACKDAARIGAAPLGMLARAAGRPVTLALIQRAAGLIPAATLHPTYLAAEINAAARALNTTVTLDATAVAVATLLPGRFDQLCAQFTATPIPTPAYDDLLNTRYALDSLLRSSGQLGLHNGQPVFTEISGHNKREIAQRATALSQAIPTLTTVDVADLTPVRNRLGLPPVEDGSDPAWLAAAQHALDNNTVLWCDDAALRRLLTDCGIPTFGTVALLHLLTERSGYPDFTRQRHHDDIACLQQAYVVDLPLDKDLLTEQARNDHWQPYSAALPFARPHPWTSPAGEQLWSDLAEAVWTGAPDQLGGWYLMAAQGCTAWATPEQVPGRLAKLVSVTLKGTGTGPEPVTALWPSALHALTTCTQAALRRTPPSGEETTTIPTESDFRSLTRSTVRRRLITDENLTEQLATQIADQALP
ncbi:DUF4365 domain-containing protein [Streptomyces sp. NPDC090026]|uniref:DUF4365 domain-containing protein n=1 Tax=Streptomyces sp. NPDC090026 TaxID=3365923 RepID=UPI0037F65579